MAFLRHVALRVKDKEETRRFYEVIGFKFVGYRGPDSTSSIDLTDGTLNMTILQYDGEKTPTARGTDRVYAHWGYCGRFGETSTKNS